MHDAETEVATSWSNFAGFPESCHKPDRLLSAVLDFSGVTDEYFLLIFIDKYINSENAES